MKKKYKYKSKNRRRSGGIMYRSGMFFFKYIYIYTFFHRGDQWGDAERGC